MKFNFINTSERKISPTFLMKNVNLDKNDFFSEKKSPKWRNFAQSGHTHGSCITNGLTDPAFMYFVNKYVK